MICVCEGSDTFRKHLRHFAEMLMEQARRST